MPERIRKLVNKWGSQPRGKKHANSIEFLNCRRDKFEWENDNISTTEATGKEVRVVHPSLIARILGVELEEDYNNIAEAIKEIPGPTNEDWANDAQKDAGLSNIIGLSLLGMRNGYIGKKTLTLE